MRISCILYLIKRFAHLYSPLRQIVINRSIISNNISSNESNISFSYIYMYHKSDPFTMVSKQKKPLIMEFHILYCQLDFYFMPGWNYKC